MKLKQNIAISETGFVFDSVSGESFSLNDTGKEIIQFLQSGKSKEEIEKHFTANYVVDKSTFEKSYLDFITMLKQFQLIDDEEEQE